MNKPNAMGLSQILSKKQINTTHKQRISEIPLDSFTIPILYAYTLKYYYIYMHIYIHIYIYI